MSAFEQNAVGTAPGADASARMSEYLVGTLEMQSAFGAIDTDKSGMLEWDELEAVVLDRDPVTSSSRRSAAQLMMDHFADVIFFQPAYEERSFGMDVEQKPGLDRLLVGPTLRSLDESDRGISRTDLLAMKLALTKTETDASIAHLRKMSKISAVAQIGFGVSLAIGGTALALVPEPTMATKVGAGLALLAAVGSVPRSYETYVGKDIDDLEAYTQLNRDIIESWQVTKAALAPSKERPQGGSVLV